MRVWNRPAPYKERVGVGDLPIDADNLGLENPQFAHVMEC
jgi:hypothetical protein